MLRCKFLAFWPLCYSGLMLISMLVVGPSTVIADTPVDESSDAVLSSTSAHGGDPHSTDHAASEAEIDILAPEPALAIYTLIVFVLLLALLYRFAWGPLSRALESREQSLEAAFRDAENARTEAAALLEQHRQQMEQVQNQVRQIMDEANRKAETAYQDRLNQARSDAEATIQRATREIAAAKEQAVAELYERSADLAVSVASQVLRKEIAGDEHRRLIEIAAQELQAAGADGHGGGLA